jgi:hypothetical protein
MSRTFRINSLEFRDLHFVEMAFPASRMIDRNQMCAASVCILSCQIMTYLNEPSAAGPSRILVTFLGASSSAIRRGTVAIMSVPAATRMATVC